MAALGHWNASNRTCTSGGTRVAPRRRPAGRDPRAGLHRQLSGPNPIPPSLSDSRRRTTVHPSPTEGQRCDPLDAAPPPDNLGDLERNQLKEILTRSSALERLAYHVTSFAEMMTGLHGDRLDDWITAVQADDLPYLHSFTAGLTRDHAAVVNGLTTHHNSGPVEGAVSRLKSIKRSMYGRAKFDLLRKKILCRV
ncbi:transposase [Lentzea alba]|uniref:transposase n=1 Tax=Lentzea alba TaxID=2714351 RepID=UPI0039BEFA83